MSRIEFSQHHYCSVRLTGDLPNVRLFWKRPDGTPLSSLAALDTYVRASGSRLLFATNAGMFEPTLVPCGLHVEEGHSLWPINLRQGSGNFYLHPNGVFFVDGRGAHVMTTEAFSRQPRDCRLATQSGPMLVIAGQINPLFDPASKNLRHRSGVGVGTDGSLIFALSEEPVCFYEFARLFSEHFRCSDALYLDGSISRFWPSTQPSTEDDHFVGMIGVISGGDTNEEASR